MKERYNKYLAPAQKPIANAPPVGLPPKDLLLRAASSQPHLPAPLTAKESERLSGSAVEKQTPQGSAKRSQEAGFEAPKQRESEQEVLATTPGGKATEPSHRGAKVEPVNRGNEQREAGQAAVPDHGPVVDETVPQKPRGQQPGAKPVPQPAQQTKAPLKGALHLDPVQKVPPPITSQAGSVHNQPPGEVSRPPPQPIPRALHKVPPSGASQPAEHPEKAPKLSPAPTLQPLPPKTSPPTQVFTSPHGAAVLRAPPKPSISKPVPVHILGAAAAARELAHRDEGGAVQNTPVQRETPFTQAPESEFTVPETSPEVGDGSQRDEEALGRPTDSENEGGQEKVPAVERGEGSGGSQEMRAGERKRARDDAGAGAAAAPGVVSGAKKQRVEAQKPPAKGSLPGPVREDLWFDVLPPVKEQERPAEAGDGARAKEGPSSAACGASNGLLAVKAKGPSDGRREGRETDLGGTVMSVEAGQQRREPDGEVGPAREGGNINGENAKADRVADVSGEKEREEERPSQGPTEQLGETKRRRLRKANGELVGVLKKPGAEPVPDQTSEVPPERVSVIRSWVADFMKQYGCSQDDVITAVIGASGDFEAARAYLDPRSRGTTKGPVWSIREDHVLLTQPVGERYLHPDYVNLREALGNDAVERRLRFLGRL